MSTIVTNEDPNILSSVFVIKLFHYVIFKYFIAMRLLIMQNNCETTNEKRSQKKELARSKDDRTQHPSQYRTQ